MLINIVYAHLSEPLLLEREDGEHRVLWSNAPAAEAEAHAFFGWASYYDGLPLTRCALITAEPVVTQPGEYDPESWGRFDRWFVSASLIAKAVEKAEWYPVPIYDFLPGPYPMRPRGMSADVESDRWWRGKSGAVMILGNKTGVRGVFGSNEGDEVGDSYWVRGKVLAQWDDPFGISLAAYGRPAFDSPRYGGFINSSWEVKRDVLDRAEMSLCFDNCSHWFWSRGVFSARVVEAIESGCAPVVMGCPNWREFLPDYLHAHVQELYPRGLREIDREGFREAVLRWLGGERNPEQYSAHRLYDGLARWASGEGSPDRRWRQLPLPPSGFRRANSRRIGSFDRARRESWAPNFWNPIIEALRTSRAQS